MRLIRLAIVLAAFSVGPAQAEGEQALAKLFRDACVEQYPSFSGTAAIAQKADLKPQKDGTFKRDGYLLNPAVKFSGKRNKGCLLAVHDADPVQTGALLAKSLNRKGIKVENASRKGRRTTLLVNVNGEAARVFIQPMMRTFTSVTISSR